MTGITLEDREGRLVVVKRRHGRAGRRRLQAEIEVLSRLRHPGIVSLIAVDDGPDGPVVTMAFVGADTWATHPGSALVPGAVASLVSTLADLHAAGVVHGALDPTHVVVAPDGRPVLCGLADWRPADEASVADELDSLADTLETVAAADDGASHLLEVARAARAGTPVTELVGLADRLDPVTADPTPLPGPPAEAPSSAVDRLVGAVTRFRPPGGTGSRLLLGAAVVIVPVSLLLLGTSTSSGPATAPEGATATGGTPPPTAPEGTTATGGTPPATAPEGATPGATVLVHGGRRVAVGSAGDLVVVGDWFCRGESTPAVLRPTEGTVAVFDSWPPPGASIGPAAVTRVDDPVDLVAEHGTDCDRLRVVTARGSVLVDPRAAGS